MPLTARDPMDGPFMTRHDLTGYPDALDAPMTTGTPTATAKSISGLLRGDDEEG